MKSYDLKMDDVYDALFPYGSSIASGVSIEMEVSETKLTYTNIDYWNRRMYCNLYHLV